MYLHVGVAPDFIRSALGNDDDERKARLVQADRVREADVGSILGFGFAPFTGGTLSYIDMIGTKKFVELSKALEKKHGSRFKPSPLLLDLASNGDTFYRRFPPDKRKAA